MIAEEVKNELACKEIYRDANLSDIGDFFVELWQASEEIAEYVVNQIKEELANREKNPKKLNWKK